MKGNVKRTMTVSTQASPLDGACTLFDTCTDGLLSLHYRGGLGLLDYMGFAPTEDYKRTLEFINFVRPAFSNGVASTGHLSNPCSTPNGVEFGTCELTVEDFGRYGRKGPVRNMMKPTRYCVTSPRRRLDGTPVTDEREWDMRFAMDQMLADLRTALVTGSTLTAGQFDGLQRWIKTGYACSMLDSLIINWNWNTMSGGSGMTWNGASLASTFDLVDVLIAIIRRVKTRISWSPLLNGSPLQTGDMALVLPSSLIPCLLDFYTCWSVCPGAQYNEVNLNTYEARQFRDRLNGGAFGAGQITLDNTVIPLLPWDWGTIVGPSRGDIYLLTFGVGSNRIWQGDILSAEKAVRYMDDVSANPFFTTDGGRVLARVDTEELCRQLKLWMHLRLFCSAPWAQARIQGVTCTVPGGWISPDPLETSFYPETSFAPFIANCP